MLIPVIYQNGKHDLVKDFLLSKLIEDESILKFKRGDGWVSISSTNIRGKAKNYYYSGPGRRQQDTLAVGLDIF